MVKPSKALIDFRKSLKMADELRIRERKISKNEIPLQSDENFVYGLRGGSIVLMVGAFENFLEELIEEKLDYLNHHPNYSPTRLPTDLVFYNCKLTFEKSKERTSDYANNSDRIVIYQDAASLITNKKIDPKLFSLLADNNPNPKKVKNAFACIGIPDIFRTVKAKFDKKWKQITPGTWIWDELDNLVNRRHEVAHAAQVRGFSREDLKRYIRFLRTLSDVLDQELNSHIRKMVR
jgi:hypothetical protein